jgi:hypothetical protein
MATATERGGSDASAKVMAKIAASGAKITIHFMNPVKKNANAAGELAINPLTIIDVSTANIMCPYTRPMAELISDAEG